MPRVDIQKLAKEVGAVATVGFGKPLRKNADTEQLLIVAEWLVTERYTDDYLLFQDALRPSVEHMGDGAIGRLARIEFGLAPEAQNLYYFKQRQAEATRQLGARGEALKKLEQAMHLAVAKNLALRLDEALPEPELPAPTLYPRFKSVDEFTAHLEKNGEEIY